MKDSQNYRVFSSNEDWSLCGNLNIKIQYIISLGFGFGTAVDAQGRGYVVTLYSTNQKRQR